MKTIPCPKLEKSVEFSVWSNQGVIVIVILDAKAYSLANIKSYNFED